MLAVVLLRRIVDVRGALWNTINPDSRSHIRAALLSAYENEKDPSVLRKLCHALAKASTDWPELLTGVIGNMVRGGGKGVVVVVVVVVATAAAAAE